MGHYDYWCKLCNRGHKLTSKKGKDHAKHAEDKRIRDKWGTWGEECYLGLFSEMSGSQEATNEIKELIDVFLKTLHEMQYRYSDFGAEDTAVKDHIFYYISEKL